MKGLHAFLGSIFTVLAVSPLAAQAPVLSSIQAPYANLQSQVKMAGATYGTGTVAYGPAGTPLILGGSNFGISGTVQFIPYVNGSPGTPMQATASAWTSTMINVSVPVGATSGLITVTASGSQSNGLPFIVTSQGYGASCPVSPSNNLLQIFTSGLADGVVGQAYSMTLEAGGGTPPYSWSITNGTLPAGLTLDSSTGVISGTPTQSVQSLSLTIKVTDASSPSQAASAALNLTIETSTTPTVVYDYCIGTSNSSCASTGPGYDPTGNLLNYNDSVTGAWSMTDGNGNSGYDSLNRLIAASATSGPYAGLQATWNYDGFGNRRFESFSGDLVSQSAPPIPASTWDQYNANNQVQSSSSGSAPTYDPSGDGDVIQDDQNQYLYDADGRVCASLNRMGGPMTGYLYDADGNRVAKGPITTFSCDTSSNGFGTTGSDNLYILGPDGEQLTEMTWSSGTALYGYTNVRAAGELIASYSPNGSQVALNFQLRDWLGTLRAQTDYAGNVQQHCESLPYGNGETCVATTPYLFTGKERDSESGNDYFGARYYASSMGRWLSPDPHNPILIRQGSIAGGLPEEAANSLFFGFAENPQNWNKYAYVRNNPLGFTDPTGESPVSGDGHHLLVERGSISNPLAKDFANSIKTGGPNPPSNVWSNASGHPEYNEAVNELEQELEKTQGDSNSWSLSQWKDFATKVLNSDEPAIQNFLDQIEAEAPGSRAKLAAAIAAYQPTKAVMARTYAWAVAAVAAADLARIFSDFIVCFSCNMTHESVTHKFIYDQDY